MKLWILVGALSGKIKEAKVFHRGEKALIALREMNKSYNFPAEASSEVILFEKEI